MSAYDVRLPDVFPHGFEFSVEHIERCLEVLNKPEPPASNGSSYAVTADARDGHRKLWLSRVSAQRLADASLIPWKNSYAPR